MREDGSGISTLRRKRRRHPTRLRTREGIEEVVPGLSTWTAEDLMEAGGWDDELVDLASLDEIEEIEDEGEEVGGLDLDD